MFDLGNNEAQYFSVSIDPESFKYSEQSEDINLFKGSLGIGLSLDGGRGCVYGDRPIVVKRIFEGNEFLLRQRNDIFMLAIFR